MAGDRRLSPAELKARLQANLAVAGAKSSNPGLVATNQPVREDGVGVGSRPETSENRNTDGTEAAFAPQQTPTTGEAQATADPRQSEPEVSPNKSVRQEFRQEPQAHESTVGSGPQPVGNSEASTTRRSTENLDQSAENQTSIGSKSGSRAIEVGQSAPGDPTTELGQETQPHNAASQSPTNQYLPGNPSPQLRKKLPIATPKRPARAVLHRRDRGAVLRGYRIPIDLHRQAERAKLGLASRRGTSLFWDELLQGAIDHLLHDPKQIAEELTAARRSSEPGSPSTRVLQAAIRHDQDLRLRMLRIDLEELDGNTVRLEEIWTWLIRQVVKNEAKNS
jgi:hypothetical protein